MIRSARPAQRASGRRMAPSERAGSCLLKVKTVRSQSGVASAPVERAPREAFGRREPA